MQSINPNVDGLGGIESAPAGTGAGSPAGAGFGPPSGSGAGQHSGSGAAQQSGSGAEHRAGSGLGQAAGSGAGPPREEAQEARRIERIVFVAIGPAPGEILDDLGASVGVVDGYHFSVPARPLQTGGGYFFSYALNTLAQRPDFDPESLPEARDTILVPPIYAG